MSNTKGTQAEISKVQLDGLTRKIPGYQTGAYMGDQLPMDLMESGYTSLFGGANTNVASFIVPFDYLTSSAYMNLDVQPGTAAATVSIGISGSLNTILNAYSIATAQAVGWLDLTTNAAFTGASQFGLGNQGDIVIFSTNGNATSTGKAVWGCMITIRG